MPCCLSISFMRSVAVLLVRKIVTIFRTLATTWSTSSLASLSVVIASIWSRFASLWTLTSGNCRCYRLWKSQFPVIVEIMSCNSQVWLCVEGWHRYVVIATWSVLESSPSTMSRLAAYSSGMNLLKISFLLGGTNRGSRQSMSLRNLSSSTILKVFGDQLHQKVD